ncbi:MAG: FMN-binding protein [Propionibacteriales bacterium]|jgi:uncharacterized protein with FMN-binding domain|nr:FMN-binding protein [Propionibacteriales bacterium]
MRRIVMWLLSTVTVVVLLFGYHTSTSGPTSAGSAVISSGSSGVSGTLSGTNSSSGTSSSSSSTTTGSTSTASPQTVTGDSVQTRWGPVEVQVTVANGTITAVNVPVYPSGNGKDEEINAYALPRLIQETLDAQSAKVDMVSGATVTSDGYLQSLQSALDKAGV